ncbi:hypothetical protein DRE_05099 [Drechslerella stenobrocha 248]|uniref:Shugoshin C-terminal domain-containing protein n=1 Tax=Drechslerella stenobrocha 248 TaxID=1043628 RepID=W7HZW6_9PEZI|nr:hypothetical protein DRE_05099 [Drechslerella stenobrocha 248]
MAKLSDLNQTSNPALDSLESLKRRYQRQNRELAKANTNQAQQIQGFQAEISLQKAENLRLSAEIINLQKQLDARDSRISLSAIDGTKKVLEERLSELFDIVRSIPDGGSAVLSSKRRLSGRRFPTAIKPDLSLRERPEGVLQDVPEHEVAGQVPTSPLFPTTPRVDARVESPTKGYIPLDSAMFDIRPRRRRDSANVENMFAPVYSAEEQQSAVATKEPTKRKFPDTVELAAARDDMGDTIVASRLGDAENVVPTTNDLLPAPQPVDNSKGLKDREIAPRSVSSSRKSSDNLQETAPIQVQAQTPAPAPTTTSAAPTEHRRALEPKSTNIVNINNSPVRLPTIADFEYIKKEKLSPRDRDPVKKATRTTAKPIVVQGGENTMTPEKTVERNRRTRGVAVNYALPALNKKLRRESETLVDAVTGIQPKRRSVSNHEDGIQETLAALAPAGATPSLGEERKNLKSTIEELGRRAGKMSIHHDAQTDVEPIEWKATSERIGKESGMSDREIRRIITDRASRQRDQRLEQARKDIYEFTTSESPGTAEATRKSAAERLGGVAASIGGSHQRRTSGGVPIIGIGSRREPENRTSVAAAAPTAPTTSLKSASDLLEERRRRRATLGGSSTTVGDSKPRRTVGFADAPREERGRGAEGRRRSMVI